MTATPFRGPEPPDFETIRKLSVYAELCARYDLDPAEPWDTAVCASIADTLAFHAEYEELRARLAGWTGEITAAWLEGLAAAGEDTGTMRLVDRHGPVLVLADRFGGWWTVTCERSDPARLAQAMARARWWRAGMS
jgi:hypothetical protein